MFGVGLFIIIIGVANVLFPYHLSKLGKRKFMDTSEPSEKEKKVNQYGGLIFMVLGIVILGYGWLF